MKKHTKATLIFIFLIVLAALATALTSKEIDNLCKFGQDGEILYRNNGLWDCNTFDNTINNSFGCMTDDHNSTRIELVTADVWYNHTSQEECEATGMPIMDQIGLTVKANGIYHVIWVISASGKANSYIHTGLAVNGIIENLTIADRQLDNSGSVGSYSGQGIISLSIDDEVYLQSHAEQNNKYIDVEHSTVTIMKVGN